MRHYPLWVLAPILILMSCLTDDPNGSAPVEAPSSSEGHVGQETPPAEVAEEKAEEKTDRKTVEIIDTLYEDADDSGKTLEAIEQSGTDDLSPHSRLVYAILLRNEGEYDASREQLGIILDENPGMAEAWFNLALLEHAVQDEAARDRALDAAIDADGTSDEAYSFRGIIAAERADWAAAEADYRKALDLNPESVDSLAGLGRVMMNNKEWDEALPLFNRALNLDPNDTYVLVDRARVLNAREEYISALKDLGRAIELEPDVPWHYLDRARIRFRFINDLSGALADLKEVERLDPNNFFAQVYLAGIYDQQRQFATSLDYYHRVIEARPDYIWAFMPLGKLEWMNGNFDEAASWFEKASARDPEEFSFHLMRGVSLLQAGRMNEADRVFSQAIKSYRSGDTLYEVIRFCADRSSDYYAVNALNKESNTVLRERLWFYIGAVYESMNNPLGAQAAYGRIADKTGHMEFDLAWAALNGMGD